MKSRVVNGRKVLFPDSMTDQEIDAVIDPNGLMLKEVIKSLQVTQTVTVDAIAENTKAVTEAVDSLQPESFDYDRLVKSLAEAMKPPPEIKRPKLIESKPIRNEKGVTTTIKHIYEVG